MAAKARTRCGAVGLRRRMPRPKHTCVCLPTHLVQSVCDKQRLLFGEHGSLGCSRGTLLVVAVRRGSSGDGACFAGCGALVGAAKPGGGGQGDSGQDRDQAAPAPALPSVACQKSSAAFRMKAQQAPPHHASKSSPESKRVGMRKLSRLHSSPMLFWRGVPAGVEWGVGWVGVGGWGWGVGGGGGWGGRGPARARAGAGGEVERWKRCVWASISQLLILGPASPATLRAPPESLGSHEVGARAS